MVPHDSHAVCVAAVLRFRVPPLSGRLAPAPAPGLLKSPTATPF
jgi:hypothetical protein